MWLLFLFPVATREGTLHSSWSSSKKKTAPRTMKINTELPPYRFIIYESKSRRPPCTRLAHTSIVPTTKEKHSNTKVSSLVMKWVQRTRHFAHRDVDSSDLIVFKHQRHFLFAVPWKRKLLQAGPKCKVSRQLPRLRYAFVKVLRGLSWGGS